MIKYADADITKIMMVCDDYDGEHYYDEPEDYFDSLLDDYKLEDLEVETMYGTDMIKPEIDASKVVGDITERLYEDGYVNEEFTFDEDIKPLQAIFDKWIEKVPYSYWVDSKYPIDVSEEFSQWKRKEEEF